MIEDATQIERETMALDTEPARISVAIWKRLTELDGKPNPTLEDVRGMLFGDRVYIREAFDRIEGGLENEIPITCESCGRKFTHYLNIGRIEFFAPKMMA
jgi:hypothetical protein